MQRSSRLGRLLALAGVAVWLGSPPSLAQAKPRKAGPDAGPAGKAPADGKSPPRVSLLRLQVIKPDPGPSETPAGFPRRHRFEAAPREGTTLTFLIDEPQQWIPFTIKVPCARSRRSPSSGRRTRKSSTRQSLARDARHLPRSFSAASRAPTAIRRRPPSTRTAWPP